MPSLTARWTARLLAVLFCLANCSLLLAQSTGGRILGRVADPSGAVLPNVKVVLVNEATSSARETLTNTSGDYVFVAVPPGVYRAEFELTGFKKNVQKSLTVEVNQVLTLNSTLQLGQAKEVVEVTSDAPLVDTSSTQLGATVNTRAVSQLPLNARDTYQLLQLQPGVQSQVGSDLFYGSDRAGVVSVNGGRGRSNNFSVNGGDANDQFANLPAVQPTPDSIQEFRVLTNTFDAEYGRNSGAVVNVVTKSGTNTFHGNVYEFFRNTVLNSKNYFETDKGDFKQNQFGGTFGGPIKKDRTFFFVSYEGRRVRRGVASDSIAVPSGAERTGDFSDGFAPNDPNLPVFSGTLTDDLLSGRTGCSAAIAAGGGAAPTPGTAYSAIFPGNQIPLACMDPTAVDLMTQFVPHANSADGLFFQASPGQKERTDQFTVKFDHRINDKQNFNAYYYFNDTNLADPFARFQAGGATVPGFGALTRERFQQWNLTHNWTLSNNLINEFHFTYFRQAQGDFLHPQRTNLVQDSCATVPAAECFSNPTDPRLGITPNLGTGREGVPFIDVSGGFAIGNNFEGEIPQVGSTFQWSDNLTKVSGNHTMKFGTDIRRQRFDQTLFFNVNGQYTYFGGGPNDVGFADNLFPNYLLGLPDSYIQGSAQTENVRSTIFALFAQDSWKLRPNLTLNYGLRWELFTPLTDISHRVQTFRPGQETKIFPCQLGNLPGGQPNPLIGVFGSTDCSPTGPAASVNPLGLVVPGDEGVPDALTSTYYKTFAPRIGIAWSPGTSGKTSIRAGWGMFYNPIEQLVLEQFSAEPPFGGSSSISNGQFNNPFLLQDGTPVPNPFNGILNPTRGQPVDWSVFRPILLYGQFAPHLRTQYSVQYNLNVQRELAPNLVLQLGYVGSQGHRLLATHDVNASNPQTCLDLHNISQATANGDLDCGQFFSESSYDVPAGAIPAGMTLHLPYGSVPSVTGPNNPEITLVGLRPHSSPLCQPTTGAGCPPDGVPVFSSVFAQDTIANSNYNSFQAMLEKRYSGGLQFQASYTFSKSFDQASSFEGILNPVDFSKTYSLSQFDSRHRFVFSYVWDLPVPKYDGAKGKILNGWQMSGIATFQSGFPIRITSSADNELMNSFDFELPGEPLQLAPLHTQDPRTHGGYYFDPNSFTENASDDSVPLCTDTPGFGCFVPNQLFGKIPDTKRTLCCGPGILNFDFSFLKRTEITETKYLEFRADFFNIFNHTQFTNPSGNSSDGGDFGRVTRARDPRLLQFALKFYF